MMIEKKKKEEKKEEALLLPFKKKKKTISIIFKYMKTLRRENACIKIALDRQEQKL